MPAMRKRPKAYRCPQRVLLFLVTAAFVAMLFRVCFQLTLFHYSLLSSDADGSRTISEKPYSQEIISRTRTIPILPSRYAQKKNARATPKQKKRSALEINSKNNMVVFAETNQDWGRRAQRKENTLRRHQEVNAIVAASTIEKDFHGIKPRAYDPWPANVPLPCYAPIKRKHWDRPYSPPTAHKGLLFMKLMKTGGSTAAGINIRILQHLARQQQQQRRQERQARKVPQFQFCQGRFEHAWGYEMLEGRKRQNSFLWTMVRDPTDRAISQFFHFKVSREGMPNTDSNFQKYLARERRILHNYYLQVLSPRNMEYFIPEHEAPNLANQILDEYDFIGITERMEESAVALMMLLRLENTTMRPFLYLNSKGSGGYDDGAFNGTCTYIQPKQISSGMHQYFAHRQWKSVIHWDRMLYEAANRSLDLTIDRLGRDRFESLLSTFRRAQQVAQERCISRQVFPCTVTGQINPNEACLWKDSACGSECLDEVVQDLGL